MMMHYRPVLTAALLAAANTVPAMAAPVGLEEVVVTAQKRSESLQDTPISVAAFTSADLEARGISNLVDLHAQVPNLQLTPHPNSATTSRIFIRGIGNLDDQITQDPAVAVYIDGVYIGRSQGLANEVAELERIEVLRGPQGSLYGRNATGGAINFITKAPELGEFQARQDFSFGNYDLFRSRTRLNIPLGETLAAEFGYLHSRKDGYVDNRGTGVDRFGDQRRDSYRAALRWSPTANLDVRYSYDRTDVEDTPPYVAAVPFHPQTIKRPDEGADSVSNLRRNDIRAQGHLLDASWEISDQLTLRSVTGYRKLDNASNQNYLAGVLGPFALFTNQFDDEQKQFSEELQAIGTAFDAQLNYVLGLYYFDESATTQASTMTAAGRRTDRSITADNRAYAVYGQGTWSPALFDARLHLTLGARWSRDERKATVQDTIVDDSGVTVNPMGRGDNSFSNTSPTLIVSYDITDDANVYGKVSRGYRSGGYNIRASTVERFNAGFDPEELTSYEVGAKSDWLDRRLRVNLATFYSRYKDVQVNTQSDPDNPTRTDVLNAGKARIYGAELDITARPIANFTATIAYGYTNAKYKKIEGLLGENIADRYVFTNIPRHSLAVDLEYVIPNTRIGTLTAGLNYSFQDDTYAASNDRRYVIDDYELINARLMLTDLPVGPAGLQFSLWGRNLADEEYYSFHGDSGMPSAIFGDPRSYGVDVSISF